MTYSFLGLSVCLDRRSIPFGKIQKSAYFFYFPADRHVLRFFARFSTR